MKNSTVNLELSQSKSYAGLLTLQLLTLTEKNGTDSSVKQGGEAVADTLSSSPAILPLLNACNTRTTIDKESITREGTGTFARMESEPAEARINNVLTASIVHCSYQDEEDINDNGNWRRFSNSSTGEKSNWVVEDRVDAPYSTGFKMMGLTPPIPEGSKEVDSEAYLKALSKWCAKLMKMTSAEMASWITTFIHDNTPGGLWFGHDHRETHWETVQQFVEHQLKDESGGQEELLRFILFNFARISRVVIAIV